MIKTAYFQYNTKKKLSTLGDNLPATQIDKWYDAVYAHPDLKPVEPVMDQALNSLTNTDVIELYEAYAESTLAGIECLKSLLESAQHPPSRTDIHSCRLAVPSHNSYLCRVGLQARHSLLR